MRRTPFAIPEAKPQIAVRETAARKSGTPKADSHEADLAKMRSKKLKSDQEAKAKKNAAAPGKKAESQRSREILRQMHFQPRHIRVCAMPTRIIILVWRQRILPKAQRKVQPVLVPGSNMVESCGSTKKLERLEKKGKNKDAVDSIFAERMSLIRRLVPNLFSRWRQKQAIKKSMPLRRQVRPLRRTQHLAQPKLHRVLSV